MSLISHANFCKAAAVLAAASAAFSVAAPAREFRAADTQSEDYPTVQALNFMARMVEERTRGRHTIRVFHSRQLGEEKETIEQTRVGAIDLNRTNVAPIGFLVPAANVLTLPFLFRSFDHLHKVLDGDDRRRDPGRLRAPRFHRPDLLQFRRAVDLQQRQAGSHHGRHEGAAHPGPAERDHVRHDQGARRRADRASLRSGDRPGSRPG